MKDDDISKIIWDEPIIGSDHNEIFEKAWKATEPLRRKEKQDRIILYSAMLIIWLLFTIGMLFL